VSHNLRVAPSVGNGPQRFLTNDRFSFTVQRIYYKAELPNCYGNKPSKITIRAENKQQKPEQKNIEHRFNVTNEERTTLELRNETY
jgi:hypothetical protein